MKNKKIVILVIIGLIAGVSATVFHFKAQKHIEESKAILKAISISNQQREEAMKARRKNGNEVTNPTTQNDDVAIDPKPIQ